MNAHDRRFSLPASPHFTSPCIVTVIEGHIHFWDRFRGTFLCDVLVPIELDASGLRRITAFAWNRHAPDYMFATGTAHGEVCIWTPVHSEKKSASIQDAEKEAQEKGDGVSPDSKLDEGGVLDDSATSLTESWQLFGSSAWSWSSEGHGSEWPVAASTSHSYAAWQSFGSSRCNWRSDGDEPQ